MDHIQRNFIERELAHQTADLGLEDKDFQEWVSAGYTHKAVCHYGKLFAVWEQFADEPELRGSIEVRALTCDTREGFGVKLQDQGGETMWIGHTPKRVFDLPIFAHVPFMPEVHFLPRSPEVPSFILRFPIVFKMASNPKIKPVEGHIYLTQVGEFRQTYTKYADLSL